MTPSTRDQQIKNWLVSLGGHDSGDTAGLLTGIAVLIGLLAQRLERPVGYMTFQRKSGEVVRARLSARTVAAFDPATRRLKQWLASKEKPVLVLENGTVLDDTAGLELVEATDEEKEELDRAGYRFAPLHPER